MLRLHAALILILHAYVLLLLMSFGDKTSYALCAVHTMHFASTKPDNKYVADTFYHTFIIFWSNH